MKLEHGKHAGTMNMRGIVILLLAALLICMCVSAASAENTDYTVRTENGYAVITGVRSGFSGKLTIPEKVNGLPVIRIADSAFEGCTGITSVVLPSSLNTIGKNAFKGCTGLTQIKIPAGTVTIGPFAFYGCRNLTTVTLSNDITTMQKGVFSNCPALKTMSHAARTKVKSLTLTPGEQTVDLTDTLDLTATVSPSGASNRALIWTSSDESVVTVVDGTVTGVSVGTATVTCTAADNSSVKATCAITVQIPVLEIVKQPENTAGTAGTTVKYEVETTGKNLTYQWQFLEPGGKWTDSPATGNKTAVLTVNVTEYKNGYKYRCIITNKLGNSITTTPATLTVRPKPAITAQPANQTVLTGTSAKFTVKATGDGLKYQWQYKTASGTAWANTAVTGSTTATLTIAAVASKNGNQYRCIVTDQYGNKLTTTTALLTVGDFGITTQPVSKTAAADTEAKFTVAASGNGLKYQWQYRASSSGTWANTSATGSTTATLTVAVTAAKNGYQYRCKITDSSNISIFSNAATLTVPAVLKITAQPANKTAVADTDAKFTVAVSGDGLKYQWQYRASSTGTWYTTSATGSTTATLTVAVTTAKNGYQYRCKVTDQYNQSTFSSAATLTVSGVLKITTQPKSQTGAADSSVKFTVVASGDGLKYQWQYRASSSGTWANTSATGATTATLTVAVTAAKSGYQYRCKVTDQYSQSVLSDTATLTVPAMLIIRTQPAGKTATAGTNVQFTVAATGDGLKYQWQYMTASGTSWTNTTATGATTATLTVAVTAAKDGYHYRCKVTDQYGESVFTNAATLTVPAALQITTQPKNQTGAADTDVKFTVAASGEGLKYQWQYRTSSTGTWANTSATGATTATLTVAVTAAKNGYQYRCKVTDQNGQSVTSNAATLTVPAMLIIKTQPAGKTAAAGTNAQFTVAATGDGLKYQWQYRTSSTGTWANTSATGATTATLTVAVTSEKNGYQYRCKVSDQYGESVFTNAATLSTPAELKITTQPVNKTVAAGTDAKFTVKASGTGLKYQWQYRASSGANWANTTATGATTATLTIPGTASRNGYQYRCVVTDQSGKTVNSSAVTLTVQ